MKAPFRAARAAHLLFLGCLVAFGGGSAAAGPGQLTVEEAVALAREGSEAVRMKVLQAGKSEEVRAEARAKALPRLSLEASGSYLANPPEGISLQKGELGSLSTPLGQIMLPDKDIVLAAGAEHTFFKASASLAQPLFTWGKIASAIRLAEEEVRIAGIDLERQRLDIGKDVRTAYFGALLAESSLSILARMRDTYAAVLSDRRKSFEEGASTRQAVLEAEAGFAALETKLVEARESLATARESLGMLAGADARDKELASGFRDSLPSLDEETLAASAIARSKDRELAVARSDQARTRIDLARGGAALLPDLSFAVTFDLTGQRIPFLDASWTDTWDWCLALSLGTRVTLFDAGESWARVGEAEKDLQTAVIGIVQLEKLLRVRVRMAVQEARERHAEVAEKRAKAALAEEQAKNARVSYENELATREEASMAELGRLTAELETALSLHAFERALGELEYLAGADLGR